MEWALEMSLKLFGKMFKKSEAQHGAFYLQRLLYKVTKKQLKLLFLLSSDDAESPPLAVPTGAMEHAAHHTQR